nr:ran GTPase-activating protein 1-like [Ciona intestinalis]|eukprot:XP_026690179.1 ran GTPase-activating protein 1-like [Ciona intestinalis]
MAADEEHNVGEVTALFEQTSVRKENIISFKGQGKKLDTAADAAEIIQAIEESKDVQVLELVGNTVGVDAAKAVANALRNKPELQRCLWADMFTGRLRSEIPISLRSLGDAIITSKARLVELDLSDNAFGPDCAKACVELLKSPSAFTLQILKFNNNGLGGGGIILAQTLIECYEKSSAEGKPLKLKVFVAGRNRLENPGAKALAKAFKTIGTLEEIQLPQNGIQHAGITALADAVKHSPSLRHLNLNDNTFTDKGAISMAEAMKHIDSLEIVNFGDCLVRTNGAKAIGKSLEDSNPNLKELLLSFGEIQLEGGIAICNGLENKEFLQKLDLNGNKFGEEGVDEVKDRANDFCCKNALTSLDDDEGIDSDSDEEDSCGEDDNDGRSPEDEQIDSQLLNGQVDLNPKCFLEQVTAPSLVCLSTKERSNLLEEVAELVTNAEATADACLKLSGLLNEKCLDHITTCSDADAQELRSAVFQAVDILLRDAFQKYPNTPMLVINPFLVRMGLLKSEDKKFHAPFDIRPMVVTLGHACQQAYFPTFTRRLVRSVVAKESKVWNNKSIQLRPQLLQILYL